MHVLKVGSICQIHPFISTLPGTMDSFMWSLSYPVRLWNVGGSTKVPARAPEITHGVTP